MGRTDFNPPPPPVDGSPMPNRHSSIQPWVPTLYIILIVLVVFIILSVLNRILGPLNIRAAINVARSTRFEKEGQSSRAYRPNMATMGLYGHTGEIVFTENCKKQGLYNLRFILGASVQVLGRGSLGTTYKVLLCDGSVIALKRLKETTLKQKDFDQYVQKLARFQAKNILPVQSYYDSKGLTFLVYEYMCLGSLSSLIQGGRECNHTPLDWPTRIDIAIDVAHALACLHANTIVHGNIKASNIFLTLDFTPMLSEYGLVQMSLPALAEEATVGYKAPELVDASAPDYMSDVYSFGVLLMELLTGIAPNSFTSRGAGSSEESIDTSTSLYASDLLEWVLKMTREKCIEDVFDPELSPESFEATLVRILHVAFTCISEAIDSRPAMSTVLEMMKHIKDIQENGRFPSFGKASTDAMFENESDQALLIPRSYSCTSLPLVLCLNKF